MILLLYDIIQTQSVSYSVHHDDKLYKSATVLCYSFDGVVTIFYFPSKLMNWLRMHNIEKLWHSYWLSDLNPCYQNYFTFIKDNKVVQQ